MGAVLNTQSKWWLCCLVSLFQLLDSLYLEFQHQAVPLQTTMTTLEITMIQPETFQVITMILLETTLALEITMILILPETIQEIIMILLGTTGFGDYYDTTGDYSGFGDYYDTSG